MKVLLGERDAAHEAETAMLKKLQVAQALEKARQSKLHTLEGRVKQQQDAVQQQEDRLAYLKLQFEAAVEKLDEWERQWRSIQAEEFFRQKRKSTQLSARSSAGKPSVTFEERLKLAETTVCDGRDELTKLQDTITDLERAAASIDDRERAAGHRSAQLAIQFADLVDDFETKQRSRQTCRTSEEKLQTRIEQCLEKLDSAKKRKLRGEAEVARLEELLDSGAEESAKWQMDVIAASEALDKAKEDIGDLLSM